MCLEQGFRKPTKKQTEGVGSKLFSEAGAGTDRGQSKCRPINTWINERDFRSLYHDKPVEGYGFHIFLRKKDAMEFENAFRIVRRVKYRKATAVGVFQEWWKGLDLKNIVAKEIFIEAK